MTLALCFETTTIFDHKQFDSECGIYFLTDAKKSRIGLENPAGPYTRRYKFFITTHTNFNIHIFF